MGRSRPTHRVDLVLRWVAISDGGIEPRRARSGDAGYDLFVSERTVIPAFSYATVNTGIAIELPSRTWGMLVPRSSTLRTRGLHVMTGIIDNGYRGEMGCGVWNMTGSDVVVEPGERITQLILMPLVVVPVEQVENLTPSDRGGSGFGSTGR